ncbi:MAG: hypothetical protein L6Q78_07950 [Bacteroidia bacterium]|nr:hypothetical protein [Bacteroidia bacterium]
MKRLDQTTFIQQIAQLGQVWSVNNKRYHSILVEGGKVKFIREGKQRYESIDLDELYSLYLNVAHPTNSEARKYISGRVQSPAVSIINALSGSPNLVLQSSVPTKEDQPAPVVSKHISSTKNVDPEKDETRFFNALTELIGVDTLLSKSIAKPISSSDLFLSDNFKDYGFNSTIEANFTTILVELQSNLLFGSKSLSHYVDGIIINHPKLGSRIVEFDEEQHFTLALFAALQIQSRQIKNEFNDHYLQILNDVNYLNNHVFRKHRIKNKVVAFPESFSAFLQWLQNVNEKESGYIEPKENGFPYLGGRMAQRAYYDCLRNAAHFSNKNMGMLSPLRFPKKYFEDTAGLSFNKIGKDGIKEMIKQYLNHIYKLKI